MDTTGDAEPEAGRGAGPRRALEGAGDARTEAAGAVVDETETEAEVMAFERGNGASEMENGNKANETEKAGNGTNDNIDTGNSTNQAGDIDTGNGTNQTGNGDIDTGNGTNQTGNGDIDTGNGTNQTGNDDIDTGNGTNQTGNGNVDTGGGSVDTENYKNGTGNDGGATGNDEEKSGFLESSINGDDNDESRSNVCERVGEQGADQSSASGGNEILAEEVKGRMGDTGSGGEEGGTAGGQDQVATADIDRVEASHLDKEDLSTQEDTGLTWSVITPAQSPMQPTLEAFPSAQVAVLSSVQSPQTPLLSTLPPAGAPLSLTIPERDSPLGGQPEEGQEEQSLLSASVKGRRGLGDSSEYLEHPLLDSEDGQENQPLLQVQNLTASPRRTVNAQRPGQRANTAAAASTLPHHHRTSTQQPQHPQDHKQHHQQQQCAASSPDLTPGAQEAGIVVGALPGVHHLVSPQASTGHSSGLVPLRLTTGQALAPSMASSRVAGGQPILTTLQSPQQPHRVRQAPQQPVLAPLHLPPPHLQAAPLHPSSALTPPAYSPTPQGAPSPSGGCPTQEGHVERRSGEVYRGDLAQGGHGSAAEGEGAAGGSPQEQDGREPFTPSGRLEMVQPPSGLRSPQARPSRNLHLDLGWVWGQDATRCRAARPERRNRKARVVSPQVAAPAGDMDTADSGLGTADGDLSFAGPYPPCLLPTAADIAANTQTIFMLSDKWKSLFDKYDPEGQGEVSVDDFRSLLADVRFRSQVAPHKLEVLETLAGNGRSSVTYQDLVSIMSNKRRRSFKIAVHCRDQDIVSENDFRLPGAPPGLFARMVRRIANEFLTDERDRQYYADHYTCCPPPIFVPAVTLVEVGFFIYYSVEAGDIGPSGPVPKNSMFIYRPDKRIEIWRFFFYMLIHAGWVHLFFNMLVQLLVGVPLEMVHGSCRIGTVYMAGVLAGSLGTSVFDMNAYLVGASGGVYALLAAHLANILLNYSEMELGIFKLVAVFIIASADVGFAIWDRYSADTSAPPVGYVSHIMGALAGLTIGLLVLKNFQQKLHSQILWWVALGVYCVCTLFAILWNIFYY